VQWRSGRFPIARRSLDHLARLAAGSNQRPSRLAAGLPTGCVLLASGLPPKEQRQLAQALECLGLACRATSALLLRSKAAAAGGLAALQQAADTCSQHLSSYTLWLLASLGGSGAKRQEGGPQLLLALQATRQACALVQQLRRSRRGLDCQPLQPLLLQLLAAVCSQPVQQQQQQQQQQQAGEAEPALAAVSFSRSGIRLQAAVLWAAKQLAVLPEAMGAVLREGLLRLVEESLVAAGLEGLAEGVEQALAEAE
jgi:hypothetical protein